MGQNQERNDKKLEQVKGGNVISQITGNGKYSMQCPSCHTVITGDTKEECARNYEVHSRICYVAII